MSHGTQVSYKAGCRCRDCTEAQRVATANYRARRRDKRRVAFLLAAEAVEARAGQHPWIADGTLARELLSVAAQLRRSAFSAARTNGAA